MDVLEDNKQLDWDGDSQHVFGEWVFHAVFDNEGHGICFMDRGFDLCRKGDNGNKRVWQKEVDKQQPRRGSGGQDVRCVLEDVQPCAPWRTSSDGCSTQTRLKGAWMRKEKKVLGTQTMSAAEPWITALTAWRSERVRRGMDDESMFGTRRRRPKSVRTDLFLRASAMVVVMNSWTPLNWWAGTGWFCDGATEEVRGR